MAKENILSIFVDESGDFGQFDPKHPMYYVAMVLHEQSNDISSNIATLDALISNWGYPNHAIHTGPLIRKEGAYSHDLRENRLSQVADLICTIEMLADKTEFTVSETEFFQSKNAFKKNTLKNIKKKRL